MVGKSVTIDWNQKEEKETQSHRVVRDRPEVYDCVSWQGDGHGLSILHKIGPDIGVRWVFYILGPDRALSGKFASHPKAQLVHRFHPNTHPEIR